MSCPCSTSLTLTDLWTPFLIIFLSCCNKPSQIGQLRITEIHCLTVLRPEVQSQDVDRAVVPLMTLGKGLFQASLPASGSPQACGSTSEVFTKSSLCASPNLPLYRDIRDTGLGGPPLLQYEFLILTTHICTISGVMSPFKVLGVRGFNTEDGDGDTQFNP